MTSHYPTPITPRPPVSRAMAFGPLTWVPVFRALACAPLLVLLLSPTRAAACAVCFGQTDSPLAEGMNWGILSLLAVVVLIWAAILTVVITLARRAARLARQTPADPASLLNSSVQA